MKPVAAVATCPFASHAQPRLASHASAPPNISTHNHLHLSASTFFWTSPRLIDTHTRTPGGPVATAVSTTLARPPCKQSPPSCSHHAIHLPRSHATQSDGLGLLNCDGRVCCRLLHTSSPLHVRASHDQSLVMLRAFPTSSMRLQSCSQCDAMQTCFLA